MLKFYIWLLDIFVLLIGKIFFKIGCFLSINYSDGDGFEWGIRWLNDGKWIELFNLNNFVNVRVSVVINV